MLHMLRILSIEEINQDREKFLEQINANVNPELNKIGLEIINVKWILEITTLAFIISLVF